MKEQATFCSEVIRNTKALDPPVRRVVNAAHLGGRMRDQTARVCKFFRTLVTANRRLLLRRLFVIRHLVRILMICSLVLSMICASQATAVQVQLKQSLQIQSIDEQSLENSSIIAAGSVVDVPDQYRVSDASGNFSYELTLNNWLQNAGKLGIKTSDREGGLLAKMQDRVDYYYPVRIVSLANGSSLKSYRGQTYFLALRILSRQDKRLITTQAGQAVPVNRIHNEANSLCPDGTCGERSSTPMFDRLVSELGPILRQAEAHETANKRRTSGDFAHMNSQFQRSCGFSLDSFVPVVKKYSLAAGVPPDIMLSIMIQESSGRCYETGTNQDNTRDSGLFGVNSRTASRYPRCSRDQIAQMKRTSANALSTGPECIENPVFNLRLALGIILTKVHDLTGLTAKSHGHNLAAFDESQLRDSNGNYTPTAWRLAVSSYNGGEKWVLQAKSDLEAFNKTNGTQLSPYNWEDLRVFYLRRYLSDNREKAYFGRAEGGRQESAIANLGYTENIVPGARTGSGAITSVAELWQEYESNHDN